MRLLKESALKVNKPYLLRNDSKLLEAPYVNDMNIHPYFAYDLQSSLGDNLEQLLEDFPVFVSWFYKNTNKEIIRQHIELFVAWIVAHDYYSEITYGDSSEEYVQEHWPEIDYKSSLDEAQDMDEDQFMELYELINNETNQEFLRLRLGGAYTSDGPANNIYFRISSNGFNWFNLIWQLVYDNRYMLRNIFISEDSQSGKGNGNYAWRGEEVADMPVDDFLNLPGNPIFEAKNAFSAHIQKGYLLNEDVTARDYARLNRMYARKRGVSTLRFIPEKYIMTREAFSEKQEASDVATINKWAKQIEAKLVKGSMNIKQAKGQFWQLCEPMLNDLLSDNQDELYDHLNDIIADTVEDWQKRFTK